MSSPEQPNQSSESQRSSYGEHISKLTMELQEMADQTNAKNNSEIAPTDTDRLQVFDSVTKAESRRYEPGEQYRFLIHGVLDDTEARAGELGASGTNGFDRTSHDRPLNCSLIDSAHTTTFEGKNGFIIKPPTDGESVVAAYNSDAGVNDTSIEGNVPTAEQLLDSTSPADYNQVNITRGQIEGVYIRVRPDGSELGSPGQNAQLRQLAETHGWPVAEIVAKPLELKAGEPSMSTEVMGDDLTKISIDLPENGSILKFAIVKYDDLDRARQANEKAHFTFDEHGIDIRLRQIDEYGQSGFGNITDSAILARVADRIAREVMPGVDEQTRQTLELGLQRLLDVKPDRDSAEKTTSQAAFEQHYAEYLSPEYIDPNNERAEAGKVQATVYEHGDHIIYTLAQIKVNEKGETIGGHDYNPEAQSFKDQEENFTRFLEMTADHPETRVVVVEGSLRGPFADRDEAIMTASDSGLSQYLAAENGVEIVAAESADNAQLIEEMVDAGVERSVAENYFVIRDAIAFLDSVANSKNSEEEKAEKMKLLGSIIYSSLGRQDREGYYNYSEEEKAEIDEKGKTREILQGQNAKVATIIGELNQLVGQDLFIVEADGAIGLNPNYPINGEEGAFSALDPAHSQGRGSELSRLNTKIRDRRIWEMVSKLEAAGKDVFMCYGGSHIMTLRPVMEALYGTPTEKNY